MTDEKYRIRDPVHGLIALNELEKRFIDTKPMQRLRDINQLSWTHYVYPGATHKRFEHSIGVMHLTSKILDHLYDFPEEPTRSLQIRQKKMSLLEMIYPSTPEISEVYRSRIQEKASGISKVGNTEYMSRRRIKRRSVNG